MFSSSLLCKCLSLSNISICKTVFVLYALNTRPYLTHFATYICFCRDRMLYFDISNFLRCSARSYFRSKSFESAFIGFVNVADLSIVTFLNLSTSLPFQCVLCLLFQ